MKKEIMNLVASKEGEFRINSVCKLHRWTSIPGNNNLDKLALNFDRIADMGRFVHNVEIESRDYDGIIDEITQAIDAHFAEIAEWLKKCLVNGYQY